MNWMTRYRTSRSVEPDRKDKTILLALLLIAWLIPSNSTAQVIVDDAKLFTEKQQQSLIDQTQEFHKKFDALMFIYTVPGTDGKSLKKFAKQSNLYRDLRPRDILFLLSKEDNKMFITTSKGSDGWLKPKLARRIQRSYVNPDLEDYGPYTGTSKAISTVTGLTTGKFGPKNLRMFPEWALGGIKIVLTILALFGTFFFIYFTAPGGRRGGAGVGYRSGGKYINNMGRGNMDRGFEGKGAGGSF